MRKRIQGLAREVGYDMPRDEAATVAAAVARAGNEDEALAILDEVMLRPRTIAEALPGSAAAREPLRPASTPSVERPEQVAALADELTEKKIVAARSAEETEAAVLHDLDKLRATRDLQIPVGERLDEAGQRVADMRSVDDLLDEADARIAAAAEIRACAMPIPEVLP